MPRYLDPKINLSLIYAAESVSVSTLSVQLYEGFGALLKNLTDITPFNIVIYDELTYKIPELDPDTEIIRVTASDNVTDIITVLRAQEGTSAKQHPVNSRLLISLTKKDWDDIEAALQALKSLLETHDHNSVYYTKTEMGLLLNEKQPTGNYSTIEQLDAAIAAIKANVPLNLDTLEKIASSIGNDENFKDKVAFLDSPTFSGEPTVPDLTESDESLKIANSNFVKQFVIKELLGDGNTNFTIKLNNDTTISLDLSHEHSIYATVQALTDALANKSNIDHNHHTEHYLKTEIDTFLSTINLTDKLFSNFKIKVSQMSHGFEVLNVLYKNQTGIYEKAIATLESNCKLNFIVTEIIDNDNFYVTLSGIIGFGCLNNGKIYLSSETAGLITTVKPTTVNHFVKELGIGISESESLLDQKDPIKIDSSSGLDANLVYYNVLSEYYARLGS